MDGESLAVWRHDGGCERIPWGDLAEVRIITTAAGPLEQDLFFVLTTRNGVVCLVPNQPDAALLTRLQQLPGFDSEAAIRAFSSAAWAEFLCWRSS